jgi:hypothetical protein
LACKAAEVNSSVSLLTDIQRIAGRPNRADRINIAVLAVQGLAQATHMNVDGPGLHIDLAAPDGVQQLFPGKDASWILHEVVKQAELGRAKVDFFPRPPDAMGDAVDNQVAAMYLIF